MWFSGVAGMPRMPKGVKSLKKKSQKTGIIETSYGKTTSTCNTYVQEAIYIHIKNKHQWIIQIDYKYMIQTWASLNELLHFSNIPEFLHQQKSSTCRGRSQLVICLLSDMQTPGNSHISPMGGGFFWGTNSSSQLPLIVFWMVSSWWLIVSIWKNMRKPNWIISQMWT